ncbi:hypothetical protein [Nocardioides sp. YIM 152588]|uniref:hypothetical protein n=1 Tax=Nocardioides sp. YIM 152588 TaxID=3158259 RepID=UPI0032E46D1B
MLRFMMCVGALWAVALAGLSVPRGAVALPMPDAAIASGAAARSEHSEARSSSGAHWQAWDKALHASVRIKVYVELHDPIGKRYVGDAVAQTYKRKMLNDGDAELDYWQIARHVVGRPSGDELLSARVKKIWASQQLTVEAESHAREWLWRRTKPKASFSDCADGVEVSVGVFTFVPGDCSEYDVWTGAIGHQRIAMDQGSIVSGYGQRAAAYVSGFTMEQGSGPAATWYEFVTFKIGNEAVPNVNLKCAKRIRGKPGKTVTRKCVIDPY